MKTTRLIIIALIFSLTARAQTVYNDASAFTLFGKISDATETRYERLPERLKEISREPVWELWKNTTGLAIRFCSDSRQISVKWETLHNGVMNHMAQTGSKGLDLYSLEYGNCTAEQITERTEKFYRILRNKHPDTPVVFLENPEFTYIQFDLADKNRIDDRNKALQAVFNDLKAKKEKNIWLIHTAGHFGTDSEATVDSVHLTDLGFLRHADFMYPKIKKILKNLL